MKIKEIIKESNEDTIENLRNECSQTIDLMNKTKKEIYHGTSYGYLDIEKIIPENNRIPKNTPKILNDLINEYLDEKRIKTNRSNSIFGLKEKDYGYGNEFYVLFPVNNANTLWFKDAEDLYISLVGYVENINNKKIKNITAYDIDENDFKKYLDTLKPNTSLKEYFYNDNPDIELLISSPLYLVYTGLFETTEFKEQIGLI